MRVEPGVWFESEDRAIAGVYKTENSGAAWRVLSGMQGRSVWSLATWLSSADRIAAGANDGVFRTGNPGATWSRISPEGDPDLRPVVALAFHPTGRNLLYAGATHLPWRTHDGGAHWESIHEGMIEDSDVSSIAVVAASPESVFASVGPGGAPSGAALPLRGAGVQSGLKSNGPLSLV